MSEDKIEQQTTGIAEEEKLRRNKEKILKFREKMDLAMPSVSDISDVRKDGYSPRGETGRASPRPDGRMSPRPHSGRTDGRMSPRPDTGRVSPRPDGRYSPRHPSPQGLYRQDGDRTQIPYGFYHQGEQDNSKPTTPRRGSERLSAAPRSRRHSERKNISEPERRSERAKDELRRAREKMGLETPKPWKNQEHDVIHLVYSGPDMNHLSHHEMGNSGLLSLNDSGYINSHNGHANSGQFFHSGQLSPSAHESRGQLTTSGQDSSRSQLIHSGNSAGKGQPANGENGTGKGQHLNGYVEGTKSLPA